MDHIYSNAYVTISADCASDCRDGFLDTQDHVYQSVQIPFHTAKRGLGTITLTSVDDTAIVYPFEKHKQQPIHTRAWTFQENFMSRRMLIYSKYRIFWACSNFRGCDGGNQAYDSYSIINSAVLSYRDASSLLTPDWTQVAEEYCRRELTEPTDKLPALSSVASYFSEKTSDDYHAGLWRSDLIRQLYWICDAPPWNNGSLFRRPKQWRAPSWSFMSVDGPIVFGTNKYPDMQQEKETQEMRYFRDIEDIETTPLSPEAPFGQITQSALKIDCPLFRVGDLISRPGHGKGENISEALIFGSRESNISAGRIILYSVKMELNFDEVVPRSSPLPITIAINSKEFILDTLHGLLDPSQELWVMILMMDHSLRQGLGAVLHGLVLSKLWNGSYHRVGTCRSDPAQYTINRSRDYKPSDPVHHIKII